MLYSVERCVPQANAPKASRVLTTEETTESETQSLGRVGDRTAAEYATQARRPRCELVSDHEALMWISVKNLKDKIFRF